MGIFENFLVYGKAEKPETVDVEASAPQNNPDFYFSGFTGLVTRTEAMSVPSVARARNIICSVGASLPIEQYNKVTGAHIEPTRVFNQPDPRVPGSYIYAWLMDDLLFNSVAYGQVLGLYADGRIAEWTRIAPNRVTPVYNTNSTEIIGYQVDNKQVPLTGVGSLITFYGLDEGVLARAGRTIRAAIALEKASETFAKNPVPQMALKSTGTIFTRERIQKLLSTFNANRSGNGTAFVNGDLDLQVLGIDPTKMQLNEARQYVALELARTIGIPAYFISAETTSMTYSNSTNERKSLIDFSLRPLLTAIEQRLSLPDFVPAQVECRFSLDDFLRGSALERAQVYQILNQLGAMSVEQIQQEEDLIK